MLIISHAYVGVNVKVKELRRLLAEFVDFTESQSPLRPLWQRKLWGNSNHNLTMTDQTDTKYCGSDGIHLSIEGKRVILANMRHHIHLISKRSDQPIRTRVYESNRSM